MQEVLIAGGGIGGLTLALALSKHGIASRVFEARDTPPREGAGIQLGPNATRILHQLGLHGALARVAVEPEAIIVNDGRSGRELTHLPLGRWMAERHGAPYWVIHRADLYDALWLAASQSSSIKIETAHALQGVTDDAGATHVELSFAEGGRAEGRVLVGADGLWSRARQHVNPDATLQHTGVTAARTVVPRNRLPERFRQPATGVWLAPSAHIVHYPVHGGDDVAIVAIAAGQTPTEGWNSAVERSVVLERFKQLCSELQDFLASATEWRQWALFRAEHIHQWSTGRVVLIGDAAHPILPFLAQGGAMAIEDAYGLAAVLVEHWAGDLTTAITSFSRQRQQRVEKVQAASVQNGHAYHLDGFAALSRNAALKTLPGHLFMRRYDWIYGYKA